MPFDSNPITFRPHRLGFFFTLAVLLGLGGACLSLCVQLHWAWLAGVALAIYLTIVLVSRYVAGSLALCGIDLVIYQGWVITREVAIPLWEARFEIHQTLIGRSFDTGTVIVIVGRRRTRLRVAQLRALRRLIAERKMHMLTLAHPHLLALSQT